MKKKENKIERQTADNLRTHYDAALINVEMLTAKIADRLLFLCKQYPDAPIARMADLEGTVIKAGKISDAFYIQSLEVDVQLKYIKTIEKWLEEQQPFVQKEINFNS